VIDPGDFNDDGRVDAADYVVWRKTLDQPVDRGVGADGDGDGMVTLADLDVWRATFGTNYLDGSGSAAVPEPAAWTLALVTLGCLIARRQIVRCSEKGTGTFCSEDSAK